MRWAGETALTSSQTCFKCFPLGTFCGHPLARQGAEAGWTGSRSGLLKLPTELSPAPSRRRRPGLTLDLPGMLTSGPSPGRRQQGLAEPWRCVLPDPAWSQRWPGPPGRPLEGSPRKPAESSLGTLGEREVTGEAGWPRVLGVGLPRPGAPEIRFILETRPCPSVTVGSALLSASCRLRPVSSTVPRLKSLVTWSLSHTAL